MSSIKSIRLVFAAALAFVSMVPSCAVADVPAPTATPITSLTGVTCTEPVAISAEDAFAHGITDPRTLAFMSFVKDLSARDRSAVRKRAAAPLAADQIDELDRALAADCSFDEVEYRTTRLVYMVARIWSASDALAIQSAAHRAIASLLLHDRVSAATRTATLAVFGTSVDALDAQLASAATPPPPAPRSSPNPEPCARIDARSMDPTPPVYPGLARVTNITGTITVEIAIDRHGYVKSATIYKKDLGPPGAAGDDLVRQTIISAGTTHYAPQFVDCKPRAGRYLFRADYNER